MTDLRPTFQTSAYRHPSEQPILAVTFLLVLAVIAFSITVTLCTSALFVGGLVLLAYQMNASHHHSLMQHATPIHAESAPRLAALVGETIARLQPGPVQVYVAPGQALNAYTFGLSDPKVVVLYAPMLQVMDADELRFVVGHELGHVRLGHTWLNTLLGGMAGIPSPFSAALLLAFTFRWWNRACELSSDRAGLLACGDVRKAESALVKLVAGPSSRDPEMYRRALETIDAEDDHAMSGFAEALSTHPMLIRRIQELRRFAATQEYQRLQALVDQNVVGRTPPVSYSG
jgi:Zn-dependent protease with chaperone function